MSLLDTDVDMSSPVLSTSDFATPKESNSPVDPPTDNAQIAQDDENSSISDADDFEEHVAPAEETRVSDKRKAQNAIFKKFIRDRQIKNCQRENDNDNKMGREDLSIGALLARKETKIITSPREYQLELFERAKKQNTIAVLDTGSGKTLIAVLLLKHVLDQELEDRAAGKSPRISFFLVASVALVYQQFAVIECNLDQTVDKFVGDMGTDLWGKPVWEDVLAKTMVVVCTADILYQCLDHSYIRMQDINVLIFDEAHHAKGNHVYARIMKDHYRNNISPPRVFSMTASPLDSNDNPVAAARELEETLHSRIATASDMSLLRNVISRPKEQVYRYDHNDVAGVSEMTSIFQMQFQALPDFSKMASKSQDARIQLGDWAADRTWIQFLEYDAARKLEQRAERLQVKENMPTTMLDRNVNIIKEAQRFIAQRPRKMLKLEPPCVSPKVLRLHKALLDRFEHPTNAKCIIFVKTRTNARALEDLLRHVPTPALKKNMHLGTIMGKGKAEVGDFTLSVKKQLDIIHAFRRGDINCLIATSIAEEGLDIPDCNLIIRFDLYTTLIQYIQSRGRARHQDSEYCHMVEDGNRAHVQAVRQVVQAEEKLQEFCRALPADRKLQGQGEDFEAAYPKERSPRSYTVPETGAILTYHNSLVYLNHFVGSLPNSAGVAPDVTYNTYSEDRKFISEVVLPLTSPLHSAIGHACQRKSIARRSAAYEALLQLFHMGHLDSHFISKQHKVLPAMRNAHLALHSYQKANYERLLKPHVWELTRGEIPGKLHIAVVELDKPGSHEQPVEPLALLTRTPLPSFPSFPLYLTGEGCKNVVVRNLAQSISIGNDRLSELNAFTLRVYLDLFSKEFESDDAMMDYWFAPIVRTWQNNDGRCSKIDSYASSIIDWALVSHVVETGRSQWTPQSTSADIVNKFIVDPGDGGRHFISLGIEAGLKPCDPVPAGTLKRRYMANILDYSDSSFKSSRGRFLNLDQPVIRAERMTHQLNLLEKPNIDSTNHDTTTYLCLEPLAISPLPTGLVRMCYCLPSILTRLEGYMIAMDGFASMGLTSKPDLALEAFTKDSDNTEEHRLEQVQVQRGMGKNYERLEFIGDCFLKMATSISIFAIYPDNDEFEFHVKRMLMICNANLRKVSLSHDLVKYIRSVGFSRRSWYPDGLKLIRGKGLSKKKPGSQQREHMHQLADKTIADVCEAMIGASLLSYSSDGSFDMAVKSVTKLVQSTDHHFERWDEYYAAYQKPSYQTSPSTASQNSSRDNIAKELGYVFKYPRLLRSAFTHPSHNFAAERIPCYQRLEFLGDALLDMTAVNFLYHAFPNKDPQWLTEHKMAMVSNKFLAALAVKLGFHKHLRSVGAHMESQNREYVLELQDAELEQRGRKDYWTHTKQPPKALSDIVEAYVGAVFVDSEFNFREVENFFDRHVRPFFVEMSMYDTFANNHPVTYFHNNMTLKFGCKNYRLMGEELPGSLPGEPSTISVAAILVHGDVISEGSASSVKNAKVKAANHANELMAGLSFEDFKKKYYCDCEGVPKEFAGQQDHIF